MGSGLHRIGAAVLSLACIAGCATYEPSGPPTAIVSPDERRLIAANRTKNAIVVGKSTRADVLATLGETLVVSFDTGYEVWVYRLGSDNAARPRREAAGEFVVLFAPSGVVAKTRTNPLARRSP